MDILKAMGVSRSGASPREFDGAGDSRMFGEKRSAPTQAEFASRFSEVQQQRATQKTAVAAKLAPSPSQAQTPSVVQDGAQGGLVETNAEGESFAAASVLTAEGPPDVALITEQDEPLDGAAPDAAVAEIPPADAAPFAPAASGAPAVETAPPAIENSETEASPGLTPETIAGAVAVDADTDAPAPEEGADSAAPQIKDASAVSQPAPAAIAVAMVPVAREDQPAAETAPELSSARPAEEPSQPSVPAPKAAVRTSETAAAQPVGPVDPETADAKPDERAAGISASEEKKLPADSAPKKEALIVSQGAIKLALDAQATPAPSTERPFHADAAFRLETAKPHAAAQAMLDAPETARQIFASIRADKSGGVDLRLDPPDLGRVRIQFSFERSDVVVATVSSERGETLDLMRRHAADLTRELQRAGFESVTLEFTSGESKGSPSREARAASSDFDLNEAPADMAPIIYLSARADNRLDRLV